MTRDEMIEAMARAGNKAFGGPWWECECTAQRGIDCDCGDALLEERLDRYDDQMSREDWRFQAKAMLDALEAAGMRIVPVDIVKEANAALKPFADRVYNGNGDMIVSCPLSGPLYSWHDEYKAAYFARKRMACVLKEAKT